MSKLIKALTEAEALMIDGDDVNVVPIAPEYCHFDYCREKATHTIVMDFRNAGFTSDLAGNYCKRHADAMAKRIRDSLRP